MSTMTAVDTIDLSAYPQTWDEFIGQDTAKRQLQVAIASAKTRSAPLGHVLLASGTPGIGKTAMALLATAELEAGMNIVSGKMSLNEARIALSVLDDRDVLFIDEIHRLVQGGKGNAEWLLHLMQDGVLMGPKGPEVQPMVTIIGATTDVGRLPETIVSRFPLRPVLKPYTLDEATEIAIDMVSHALPGGVPFPNMDDMRAIARAASHNPRTIRAIVNNLRDLALVDIDAVHDGTNYDLSEPLAWLGLTLDGLTDTACRYLVILIEDFAGQAGERAMQDRLQEPGGIDHTERLLMEKGLIAKTPQGRVLTREGITRANELRSAA